MSIVYILALVAVGTVLAAVAIDVAVALTRKPVEMSSPPTFTVVRTEDRRTLKLPFVGKDRRRVAAGSGELGGAQPRERKGLESRA
jgi:hypothetical protein